jgi:hypothetical protein
MVRKPLEITKKIFLFSFSENENEKLTTPKKECTEFKSNIFEYGHYLKGLTK